jgi:dienelactone hydrolase
MRQDRGLRDHRSRRTLILGASATLLAVLAGGSLAAQEPPPHGFLFLRGADTLGIERVTSGPSLLASELVMTGQPRLTWSAPRTGPYELGAITLTAFASVSPDAPVLQRAMLELAGDSVRFEATGQTGQKMERKLATKRGAFLFQNTSAAMLELLVQRAAATPAPVDTIPVFLTSGGQTFDCYIRVSGDSAWFTLAGQETRVSLSGGRMREAFLQSQNFRMIRVEGEVLRSLKVGLPDYSAPAGAPYRADHVKIPGKGGHTLAATLTLPTGATGRVPVVVTISGSGGQDRDEYIPLVPGFRPFRQVADTLGRRGVAVLRFDDRGMFESSGNHGIATSADFADDVRSIVTWLRARPEINPDAVFLLGHSEGGLIAPLVAVTDPKLRGIVLMAGPSRKGRDIIDYQQRYAIDHDTTHKTPQARDSAARVARVQFDSMAAREPWMKFFVAHDPVATARRVTVPVFIVQGATDRQVSAEQAEVLASTFRQSGNRDVELLMLPDRNHLFLHDPDGSPSGYTKLPSGKIGPEVLGPIVEWIVKRGAK